MKAELQPQQFKESSDSDCRAWYNREPHEIRWARELLQFHKKNCNLHCQS